MLKFAIGALAMGFAALSFGAEPLLDNERVTVWDTGGALPPAQHDFVAVSLSRVGTAVFGHRGDAPGTAHSRTIVIELKDHPLPPIANTTGYPLAFPRPHAKKLLENDKVVVWDSLWRPRVPSPMHYHDKDALVVYEATGALQSTSSDGKQTVTDFKFGGVRFSPRDHAHSELLVGGHAHAVVIELK
jgi:hypothetical protein